MPRSNPYLLDIMENYPVAKRYLVERGYAAEKVEAMPVPQVILLAATMHYEESRDEYFKWSMAPMSDIPFGISRANKSLMSIRNNQPSLFAIESLLLPAIGPAMSSNLANERNIAALEVLEAIRIYAAAHEGRLPENLSDITEVRVPQDPLHGKPFFYHCEGNKATLESPNLPTTPVDPYYLKYEIQMEPK
jgi:hypothetical protein